MRALAFGNPGSSLIRALLLGVGLAAAGAQAESLKKGDRILMGYTAANHDPARYPNPYTFDLNRGSALHLAMGVGTHFCLGAHLAKAIAEVALRQLLERVPNFKADRSRSSSNEDKNALNHWERVPATVG